MKEEMETQKTDISVELHCGTGSSFRRGLKSEKVTEN